MDDITAAAVPIAMIELVWDKCKPLIQKVIDRSPLDLDIDEIKRKLLTGDSLLVTIAEKGEMVAFFTLEVQTFKTGHKVMYVAMMGGEGFDKFVNLFLDITHKLAREYNCDELRVSGRKGWIRKLEKFGWYNKHVTIGCKVRED